MRPKYLITRQIRSNPSLRSRHYQTCIYGRSHPNHHRDLNSRARFSLILRDPFFTRLSRLTDSNFRFFTGFHSFFSFFRCPAKRVDFDSTRSLIPLFSNAGTERGLNYAVSSFSFCLKCSSNAPSQDMPHLQHGGGDHARARGPPADRSP